MGIAVLNPSYEIFERLRVQFAWCCRKESFNQLLHVDRETAKPIEPFLANGFGFDVAVM